MALIVSADLKKLLTISKVIIDNTVFQLHYKITALALFAFSVAVTGVQYFGNPIMCINNDDLDNPKKKSQMLLNTYCWIEGTFTLPSALTKEVGEHVPYPGIHHYKKGDEVIEHAYYQWVCFVLFLQGCLFYLPRIVWKHWEGGRLKNIIMDLNKPALEVKEKVSQEKTVVKYFFSRQNPVEDDDDDEVDNEKPKIIRFFTEHRGEHSSYAMQFFLCEILNFVNVIGQMYLLNTFLGGEFTTYGPKVVKFLSEDQENREDPMIRVFPRMTKCRFHRYGPSGDVQRHDALCVLPLNIVNEKIFIILWFWFVILAIFSGLAIVYRLIFIAFPRGRIIVTKSMNVFTPVEIIDNLLYKLSFGDWFVLYQLGANIDNVHHMEVMKQLNEELEDVGREVRHNESDV